MSGVIDEYGQWEHCGECNKLVLIQHLKYEPPSAEFKHGRSFCPSCFTAAKNKKLAAWFSLPLEERQRNATREDVLEQATHHVRTVGKPRYVFQTAADKWVHMDAKSHDRFPQDGDHNFTLVILEP